MARVRSYTCPPTTLVMCVGSAQRLVNYLAHYLTLEDEVNSHPRGWGSPHPSAVPTGLLACRASASTSSKRPLQALCAQDN